MLPPGDYEKELFPFDDLKQKNEALKLRKQRMSVAAGMAGAPPGGDGGDKALDGLQLPQGARGSSAIKGGKIERHAL